MKPPYRITPGILQLVASISEKLGVVKSAYLHHSPTQLRRRNRIRTIQSSLEIEGNTLTFEQATAVLEEKRVLAPEKDIREVSNSVAAYAYMDKYNPYRIDSLLKAHALMMSGLVEYPGKLRGTAVGIAKGDRITHVAPPAELVRPHLTDLLHYLQTDDDLPLIKSCVFHYEFEFVHPFTDGNGRVGRLWQTVILSRFNPVFSYLPIEEEIKKRRQEYYDALGMSDNAGNSTAFIEFMLHVIDESLEKLLQSQRSSPSPSDRIEIFRESFAADTFRRSDYLRHFRDISPATASRDLRQAVEDGRISKSGDGSITRYRFAKGRKCLPYF